MSLGLGVIPGQWACSDLPLVDIFNLVCKSSSDATSGYQYCSNLLAPVVVNNELCINLLRYFPSALSLLSCIHLKLHY